MRRGIIFMAAVLLLVFASYTTAAEVKIAYVNLQKALNDSKTGKDAKAEMANEIKKRQVEIDVKEELEKKGALLSKEVREQKEAEFSKKSQEFQRSFVQSEDVLRKKEQESV